MICPANPALGECHTPALKFRPCSEKLSAELRVQTTIELVENLEFYKNHPMSTLLANEFKTKNGSPWSVCMLVIMQAYTRKIL
jgi:hypothetical protein